MKAFSELCFFCTILPLCRHVHWGYSISERGLCIAFFQTSDASSLLFPRCGLIRGKSMRNPMPLYRNCSFCLNKLQVDGLPEKWLSGGALFVCLVK